MCTLPLCYPYVISILFTQEHFGLEVIISYKSQRIYLVCAIGECYYLYITISGCLGTQSSRPPFYALLPSDPLPPLSTPLPSVPLPSLLFFLALTPSPSYLLTSLLSSLSFLLWRFLYVVIHLVSLRVHPSALGSSAMSLIADCFYRYEQFELKPLLSLINK